MGSARPGADVGQLGCVVKLLIAVSPHPLHPPPSHPPGLSAVFSLVFERQLALELGPSCLRS